MPNIIDDLLPTLPPEPPLPRVLTGIQEAFRDASKEGWRIARDMHGDHAGKLRFVNRFVAVAVREYLLSRPYSKKIQDAIEEERKRLS